MCERHAALRRRARRNHAGQFRYERLGKKEAITGEPFDALVGDLVAALNRFKVPEREKNELLGTLAPIKKNFVTAM